MAHFDFSLHSDFTLPINWRFIKHARVCLHFDVETKNVNSVFLYCQIVYEQILDSYWHFTVCLTDSLFCMKIFEVFFTLADNLRSHLQNFNKILQAKTYIFSLFKS